MIEIADLRARLSVPVEDQARLTALRDSVVALWERSTGRLWQRQTLVELHRCPTLRNRAVFLQCFPVETVALVEQALAGNEWVALDADDWYFDGRRTVEKNNGYWYRLVRVTYTGGFVATPATGQHGTPSDIREALLLQAVFTYRRNDPDKIALRSEGLQDAQTAYVSADFHPAFKAAIAQHRRKV